MQPPKKLAYTLIEILVAISLIGGLTAGAYVVMQNVNQTSSNLKLEQDVRSVNNAIRMYLAHGGKLAPGISADEAVVAIRRQSKDTKKVAGLKGAMIDPRLNLRYQSTGEAMVTGKRAYWDDATLQFYISETGAQPGVKEFYLGSPPPPLPLTIDDTGKVVDPNLDDRQTYGSFAAVDSWVWDYENSGNSPRATPSATATTDATMSTSNSGADDDMIVLDPPAFSINGGRYDLSWFPRFVTLTPPLNAPANASEVYYIVAGGQWERYSGPIQIDDPGKTITAKTIALDLDHYVDSIEVTHSYTANQVTLDPHHTLRASYRYAELGGPLYAGSPSPTLATVPRLYLANANDMPDVFERDTVFQTYWSWDGSNPSVEGMGRYNGIDTFSNGYPGEALEINMQSFVNSDTATLKYVMLSKNTTIAFSSAVETATVTLEKTVLRKPLVTPGDGSLTGGDKIVMSPDLSGGETPANIRIFYRTDGTDPGDVNGEPAAGATLYTSSFTLDSYNTPTVRVIARMYPPTAYKRWFSTSPPTVLNYYLPYAEANVYGVQGTSKQIFNVNPSTGANSLFDDDSAYNLRALALDSARARIYYLEDNPTTVTNGWRLGYLDLLSHAHVTLGNVRGSWAYNASAQPQNLVFFDKNLYYVHASSDDLVRITLNEDATTIAAIAKVADLRNNVNWTNVGDLSVDETGLMFFVDSTKGYHRYDLISMSGYLALGTASEDFLGLAFFQGRLFGTQTRTTSIHRLAPTTGTSLSTVAAASSRKFIDLASPSSATAISITKSMWGIDDQWDGPHLIEFRNNYRSPLISVAIDYGVIKNNGVSLLTDTRYGIRGLAVSSGGMAYFVNNTALKFSGSNTWRNRPLLRLNIGTLRLGDPLNVTFVGDLQPGLAGIAGTIDPDDVVTGLAIAPTGELYGVLREGASYGSNSADYLFKCNQAATAMTGPSIGITSIGRLTSAAGTSGETEDLIFTRDGRLFCLDSWTNSLWEVSPTTGSILSLMSQNAGCYHGVATDTNDYRIIASDIGGNVTQDNFLQVNGGPDNDEIFINYRERWGYATIEAISFFQPPFLLLSNDVDLFASDGTKSIHGLDFATGQTVPVTDAPWPVRALAYDLEKREIFYLRGGSSSYTLGSFHRDTFVHKIYGDLRSWGFEYTPNALPDNLMYFGGFLWYVEPKTDNLIRVDCGSGVSTIPAGTASSVFTNQEPEWVGTDSPWELGMKFRTSVAGTITQIRYYRVSSETGSHTGRLWSSSGTQLASVAFTNETSSGWQTATLSSPVAINANTTYTVSVNCNSRYGITQGALASAVSNGQISSVAGNNGVYGTRSTFPTNSWENANYFRDVTFVGSASSTAVSSGNSIVSQKKVANLTGNELRFDLIGDLAMTPDGWVYFSAIRTDGQRFCRFQINTLSQFEVLSGPIPSPVLLPDGDTYRENWFDALAFAPAGTNGARTLYCTYSSTPSPLLTVDPVTGESTFHRNVTPALSLIDFSDLHPGELSNPSAVTLQPLLKINDLRASYTYADVGGPFITGFTPPPAQVAGPTVVLNNTNELLLSQQNSAHFQVRWSTDGVDPRTSSNASVSGSFTNGFPGQQLSVSYPLWGNRSSLPLQVVAKSLQTNVLRDSPLLAPSIPAEQMELSAPIVAEVAAANGSRQIQISANIASGLIPPGTRLFYTTNGNDPGVATDSNGLDNTVSGIAYTTTIPIPSSLPAGQTEFKVTARLYPPTGLPQWFGASDTNYITIPIGLGDGHMDVDTSSQIYPYRRGKTDGHVHAYDKKYNTTGIDFFNILDNKLREISDNVPAGQKFKILVANGNLSPGGRISINKDYNPSNNTSWVNTAVYDDTAVSALPIYSLNGSSGTTHLTKFSINFDFTDDDLGLIQGNPGHVKNNTPGIFGEWRNGALTIQVVRVNPDGSDAFTVNTAFSNGGVQGVATTGLLWEATLFYHGPGGPYNAN